MRTEVRNVNSRTTEEESLPLKEVPAALLAFYYLPKKKQLKLYYEFRRKRIAAVDAEFEILTGIDPRSFGGGREEKDLGNGQDLPR